MPYVPPIRPNSTSNRYSPYTYEHSALHEIHRDTDAARNISTSDEYSVSHMVTHSTTVAMLPNVVVATTAGATRALFRPYALPDTKPLQISQHADTLTSLSHIDTQVNTTTQTPYSERMSAFDGPTTQTESQIWRFPINEPYSSASMQQCSHTVSTCLSTESSTQQEPTYVSRAFQHNTLTQLMRTQTQQPYGLFNPLNIAAMPFVRAPTYLTQNPQMYASQPLRPAPVYPLPLTEHAHNSAFTLWTSSHSNRPAAQIAPRAVVSPQHAATMVSSVQDGVDAELYNKPSTSKIDHSNTPHTDSAEYTPRYESITPVNVDTESDSDEYIVVDSNDEDIAVDSNAIYAAEDTQDIMPETDRAPTLAQIQRIIRNHVISGTACAANCAACVALIQGRRDVSLRKVEEDAIIEYIEDNIDSGDVVCRKMYTYLLLNNRRVHAKSTIVHDRFIYTMQQRILQPMTFDLFSEQLVTTLQESDKRNPTIDPGVLDHLPMRFDSINATMLYEKVVSLNAHNARLLTTCGNAWSSYILHTFAIAVRQFTEENAFEPRRAASILETQFHRPVRFDSISRQKTTMRKVIHRRISMIHEIKTRLLQQENLVHYCLAKPAYHSIFLLVSEERLFEGLLQQQKWPSEAQLVQAVQRMRIAARGACMLSTMPGKKESNQSIIRLLNPIPEKQLSDYMIRLYADIRKRAQNNSTAVRLQFLRTAAQKATLYRGKVLKFVKQFDEESLKTERRPESTVRSWFINLKDELVHTHHFTYLTTQAIHKHITLNDVFDCAITTHAIEEAITHNFIIFENIVINTCRVFTNIILNICKESAIPGKRVLYLRDTITTVCHDIIRQIVPILHDVNMFKASSLGVVSEYERRFLGTKDLCGACSLIDAGHYTSNGVTVCISEQCLKIGVNVLQTMVPHISFCGNIVAELSRANEARMSFAAHMTKNILFTGDINSNESLQTIEKFIAHLRARYTGRT